MKGAAELPVSALLAIVIGLILLGVAVIWIMPMLGFGQTESERAALTSCCASYVLNGGCVTPDGEFQCNVPEAIESTGKMSISVLASASGVSYQNVCCGGSGGGEPIVPDEWAGWQETSTKCCANNDCSGTDECRIDFAKFASGEIPYDASDNCDDSGSDATNYGLCWEEIP